MHFTFHIREKKVQILCMSGGAILKIKGSMGFRAPNLIIAHSDNFNFWHYPILAFLVQSIWQVSSLLLSIYPCVTGAVSLPGLEQLFGVGRIGCWRQEILVQFNGQLTKRTWVEQQRLSLETALVNLIVISLNFQLNQTNQPYCHYCYTQAAPFYSL